MIRHGKAGKYATKVTARGNPEKGEGAACEFKMKSRPPLLDVDKT